MAERWQFVHSVEGGWWLRLTSDEDIIRYILATNDRYDGAMCKAVHSPLESMSLEERVKAEQSGDRNYKLLQAGTIMARKYNTTLYGAFERLQTEFGMALHRDVSENGETFINPAGGKTFSLEYDQFVWRAHLAFPDYSDKDIRIKQFDGGAHFYAYLGDTQLRDDEKLKWDTYSEAYDFAVTVVKKD